MSRHYLNIAMQDILPIPSPDVPLENIIDFKMQNKDSLKCFKRRMDKFQWSLMTCESVEEVQQRIYMLRNEIAEDLDEIEKLMSSNGIRKTKKALRSLVPIGLEAGIEALGLEGIISPSQLIIANAAVGLSAYFFCTEREAQLDEDKAYLFYARKNGIIVPPRRC